MGDFGADQFAVAVAQPLHGAANCVGGLAQAGGDLRVSLLGLLAGQKGFQRLKEIPLSVSSEFRLQARLSMVQHRQGPSAVVDFFGTQFAGGFLLIALLSDGFVQREDSGVAATFVGAGFVPLIGEVMLE